MKKLNQGGRRCQTTNLIECVGAIGQRITAPTVAAQKAARRTARQEYQETRFVSVGIGQRLSCILCLILAIYRERSS